MDTKKRRKRVTATVGYRINEVGERIPIRKEFTGKTLKEARQKRDEYLQHVKCGFTATGKMYFSHISEEWRTSVFINDGSLSSNTVKLYNGIWKRLIKTASFYPMEISQITALVLQNSINQMKQNGVPVSAIRIVVNLLRRFYKYLELNGITRNITGALIIPQDKSVTPENKSIKEIWSLKDLSTILTSFDKAPEGFRLRFLIVLASQTGARISELLAIEYDDIDLESKTLTISKQIIQTEEGLTYGPLKSNSSYRTLPLTDFVLQELEIHKAWHLAEQGNVKNVFTTKSGGFVDRHNAATACNRYYDIIGVERHGFHTYRRTFCTYLSDYGVPLETLASLAGHSTVAITAEYYVGVSDDRKAEAVKLLNNINKE